MVLTRLEAEATQAREATRADAQQLATAAADARGQELAAAQELETRAMERSVCVGAVCCAERFVCFAPCMLAKT